MRTIELREEGFFLTCPFCRRNVEKVTSREDQTPHKGDFFCCRCGQVGVLTDRTMFGMKWTMRKPTVAERFVIKFHPGVKAITKDWNARRC